MKKVKTNIESVNGVMNGKQQRMTSLEIARVTGKNHFDVLRAIRKMELAWEKVTDSKFAVSEYKDKTGRTLPCYELTKTECLYIATKFNDEARARLVLRWEQLEWAQRERRMASMAQSAPLIDLSGSRGSQASIVVLIGTDGRALELMPEIVARLLAGGRLLPADLKPYHGPVRKLLARTAHGIVREGVDDYTLYIRIPSKALLQGLGVSKETFFEAEFAKLMIQCAMQED